MATVSTEIAYKEYRVTTTGETVFVYNFLVQDPSHWELFVNGAHRTDYTVTHAGEPAGGTLVFLPSAALLVEDYILFRRVTPKTQVHDFVDHDFFLANTVEDALTKLTLMVQEIVNEMLTRVPQLPRYTPGQYRYKVLPMTARNALLGYDDDGNWVAYPLTTVAHPLLGDAMIKVEGIATAVDGWGVIVTDPTPLVPANVICLAILAQVLEPFGDAHGLTGIHVGDGTMVDRFFTNLPPTPIGPSKRHPAMDTGNEGLTITVSAVGGAFDTMGSVKVTAWYVAFPLDAILDIDPPGVTLVDEAMFKVEGVATAVDGELVVNVLPAPLVPVNTICLAVFAQVETPFGDSHGLTGIHIGDATLVNRFFTNVSPAPAVLAKRLPALDVGDAGLTVTVSAIGGAFDGVGSVKITAWYVGFTM